MLFTIDKQLVILTKQEGKVVLWSMYELNKDLKGIIENYLKEHSIEEFVKEKPWERHGKRRATCPK